MDIDAYAAAHRDQWDRLDQLTRRRRLDGAEADELVSLYRAAARHLSRIRAGAPDPELIAEVSTLVAAARGPVGRGHRWTAGTEFGGGLGGGGG